MKNTQHKLTILGLVSAFSIAPGACGDSTPEATETKGNETVSEGVSSTTLPKPNSRNDNLSFKQKRELLLTYRSPDQICTSEGGDCMLWTNLSLHCERQLNGETTDYRKPCTAAEDFRERVTGIELSTDPGAYSF